MSPKTRDCLVWFGFIFSLFCVLIGGIDMSFNVYALLLKDTFSMDQIQVEIVASTGTIGLGLTFLEPLLSGRFGYLATFLLTFLLNPVTSGFLAWASHHGQYFHSRPVYIYVAHLLMCTSNTMVSVSLMGAIINIFSERHSGKMIGVMNAVNCAGGIVYGGLLALCFSTDLSGFFLTITVSSLVFFSICYILLYPIVSSSEFKTELISSPQYEEIPGEIKENVSEDKTFLYQELDHGMATSYQGNKREVNLLNHGKGSNREAEDSPHPAEEMLIRKAISSNKSSHSRDSDFLRMIRSRFFHVITWPAVLFYASAFACMNNITAIAASVGVDDTMTTVYIITACIMIVRVGFGVMFDKLASELWGIVLMIISLVSFGTAMVIGMFWLEYPGAIYVVSALAGIGMGPSITIPLSLIVVRYGRRHLQATIGLIFIVSSVAQICIQIMFGVVYDSNRSESAQTNHSCIGIDCFYWSFAVLLGITGFVTLIQLANLCVLSCKSKM